MYEVELDRRVRKFLKAHPDWSDRVLKISAEIAIRPYVGPKIDHMKGRYHCSHRWAEGSFRFLYDIDDQTRTIYLFDAGPRGDIYGNR